MCPPQPVSIVEMCVCVCVCMCVCVYVCVFLSLTNVLLCVSCRLHEFDEQVAAVREGMARVVPVPLLSLFTGYELETMVSQATHTHTRTLSHSLALIHT